MLIRRGDRRGQSMLIAWGKLLGTLTASISQYSYDPSNVLWLVIYLEILVLDLVYVFLLSRAPRYYPVAQHEAAQSLTTTPDSNTSE